MFSGAKQKGFPVVSVTLRQSQCRWHFISLENRLTDLCSIHEQEAPENCVGWFLDMDGEVLGEANEK